MTALQPLPETWESTRGTLHAYAGAVGAIPRAYGIAHPKWWHISLKVRPTGLVTDPVPLPEGGSIELRMNLIDHEIVIESSRGTRAAVPMNHGLTGTEVGEAITGIVAAIEFDGVGLGELLDGRVGLLLAAGGVAFSAAQIATFWRPVTKD